MKCELRNPKSQIRPWGSWLIFLYLCGQLIFCHGCHGEDVDDELCVPPPAKVSGDVYRFARKVNAVYDSRETMNVAANPD